MRCRDAQNLLPEYADAVLSAPAREEVDAHLRACPACREQLDALDRALDALNRAAPAAAPDLWASFQARLAAERPLAACASTEERLPAFLEGDLRPEEQASIRHHLDGCAACSARETAFAASVAALEAAASGSAPDLWPAFTARLAREMDCAQVEDLLPVLKDGTALGARGPALEAHLEHCPGCAASRMRMEAALGALDRAARAPVVDLWPQFAARLTREENRGRAGAWGGLRALLAGPGSLLHTPAVRPALGLAAAVIVLLAVRTVVPPSRPHGSSGPQLARVEEPFRPSAVDVREAPPEPARPEVRNEPKSEQEEPRRVKRQRRARPEVTRIASRPARKVRPRRKVRPAPLIAKHPTPEPRRPEQLAPVEAIVNATPGPGEAVAAAPPVVVNTDAAKDRVMPEVVQVVRLLAGAQDASVRAFEASFE